MPPTRKQPPQTQTVLEDDFLVFPMPEATSRTPVAPLIEKEGTPLEARATERLSYVDLHQHLLEQFAPPSVVVNEKYEIVHISERAGEYLHVG